MVPPDGFIFLIVSTLNALHGLLRFYQNDFTKINVDGLFGLRLIEGQMKNIYADYELGKHKHIPVEIMRNIKEIAQNSSKIANTALPHVFDQDQEYFTQFKYLLHQPWSIYHDHRLINATLEWSPKTRRTNVMSENESDACIGEVLSSAASMAEDMQVLREMQLSESNFGCKKIKQACLNKMLNQKGLKYYELTHLILYANVAELVDCSHVMEIFLKQIGYANGLSDYYLEYCSNLLIDLKTIDRDVGGMAKMTDTYWQDLTMEMQFVCGQLGFFEFAKRDWLEAILSWQGPTGCYVIQFDAQVLDAQQQTAGNFVQKNNMDSMVQKEGNDKAPYDGRKLLREKLLPNSCSSHKSAVAAGALGTYLRFLIERTRYLQPIDLDKISAEPRTNFWNGPLIRLDQLKYPSVDLEFELISPPPSLRTDKTIFAFVLIVLLFVVITRRLCRYRSIRSIKYKLLKH